MVDCQLTFTACKMTTRKEKILQKINPKFLKLTPKLSEDSGSFIDLDSNDSLVSGAKDLMLRFFRNQDLCDKKKRNETELTISSAKYNDKNEICELITERLSLPVVNNDDDGGEKPGRRLQKLKMELQEKMSAKWEEEYKRRVEESRLCSGVKNKICGDDEECEDEDELKEITESKDDEEEDDGDEADVECDDEEENNSDTPSLVDDKNDSDVASTNGDPQNCDIVEKDDDFDNCSLIPAYQPGGGMLYGGSELTQADDELPENLLPPSLQFSLNDTSSKIIESQCEPTQKQPSPGEDIDSLFTAKTKLFSQNPNDSFDLNDAFEFCSGKFPDADNKSEIKTASDLHEADCVNSQSEASDVESEVETEVPKNRKFQNIIVFDDSEDDKEEETEEPEEATAPFKILSDDEDENPKIKTKKPRKIQYSDEEDASNNEEESETSDEEEQVDGDDEGDENRSVHYDSEENEINPKEFFDKEAELSGSEWSGDEDERGLDEFDAEEGDADVLDNNEVRSQLEKIHIRRVLDDDAREVRLIQEILFEDGDLHSDGKGRDRKFKWKNLGAFEKEKDNEVKEENGNESEDETVETEEMRKIRHEKELFLMTKKKTGELSSDDEIVEDFHSVKVTTVKTCVKLTTKTDKIENSIVSLTEKSKTTCSVCIKPNARGSFLSRNDEFLSKLAKATSGVSDNILGPKNSKNFVFTTKSPEKEIIERNTTCKRQIEDSESNREKKMKLIPPEIDTGPSILDLLV